MSSDDLPNWLNKDFLIKSLGQYLKTKNLSIKSYSIDLATQKGENYASELFRVNLNYTTNNDQNIKLHKCIIKVPYQDGFGLDLLTLQNAYDKELEMYDIILPTLTELLKSHNVLNDFFPLTMCVDYPTKAIVFEDLSLRGYVMPVRQNGFNLIHAKMLLERLAIFHAGCSAIQEIDSNIFQHFKHGMINRENKAFHTFYLTSFDAMIDLIAQWPNYENYVNKLKNLRSRLMDKAKIAFDAKRYQFNTLIHGDIWVNNSMFKYQRTNNDNNNNNMKPESVMLLDFQFSCWSSPTIDLHYFFNTSLNEDLRLNYQDELLQFYHEILSKTLKQLDFVGHIPTLHELQITFLENYIYGFISALLVQPLMINESCEDADIDALHGDNERALKFKRNMYRNKKVQNTIKNLLPVYDKKGVLD